MVAELVLIVATWNPIATLTFATPFSPPDRLGRPILLWSGNWCDLVQVTDSRCRPTDNGLLDGLHRSRILSLAVPCYFPGHFSYSSTEFRLLFINDQAPRLCSGGHATCYFVLDRRDVSVTKGARNAGCLGALLHPG